MASLHWPAAGAPGQRDGKGAPRKLWHLFTHAKTPAGGGGTMFDPRMDQSQRLLAP
jgi:hypothetical protein